MSTPLRWRLADDDGGQPSLFPVDEPVPGRRETRAVEYLHVRARRIISAVPAASRMPFRFTINAYRGCTHACTYCFARPTHTYLGLNAGEDFERRIVVKVNAAERLRAELRGPGWGGDHIALGTNTDPYQSCEGRYRLTRGIVEALVDAGNPFSVLTKSPLILRDLDLYREAAKRGLVHCSLSIGTLEEDVWQLAEPGTSPPGRRIGAIAALADAGVPCGVLVAPVLPGLSDGDEALERVVRAALDAGAEGIAPILLHLRPGVREEFMPWLARVRPDLVPAYERLYAARSGYAPKAAQDDLARRVREIVTRHGGRRRTPGRLRTGDESHAPPRAGPDQLALA